MCQLFSFKHFPFILQELSCRRRKRKNPPAPVLGQTDLWERAAPGTIRTGHLRCEQTATRFWCSAVFDVLPTCMKSIMKTKNDNEKDYGLWGFQERGLPDLSSWLGYSCHIATSFPPQRLDGTSKAGDPGSNSFVGPAVNVNRHTSLSFLCPVH